MESPVTGSSSWTTRSGSTCGRIVPGSPVPKHLQRNYAAPVLLAACHRRHHSERLRSRGDRLRERIVGGIERDVLPASKEADEVPALRCSVVADGSAQGRIARL